MNTTWLLIKRDYVERVRQRSFIIATAIFAGLIIVSAFMPTLFGAIAGASIVRIAVLVPDYSARNAIQKSLPKTDYVTTFVSLDQKGPDLPSATRAAIGANKYDAALVAYREPNGRLAFSYFPKKTTALQGESGLKNSLLRAVILSQSANKSTSAGPSLLNYKFVTHSLNNRYKSDEEQFFSQAIAYFLLIMLYIVVIMYGAFVAQGVIEEKSNRIMEVMIGAVRPSQLLAGKIFGIGGVALTQLCIYAVAAAVATMIYTLVFGEAAASAAMATNSPSQVMAQRAAMMDALGHVPWSTLVYLLVFFLLGFFSYSALYAGIGSLLTKPEEVQQYSMVVTFPIIGAYVLAIIGLTNPDMPLVTWLSMVPLLSPLLMFTRIATSSVPFWQIAVSVVLSMLAIWAFTIFAGKLYRVGVLMYGKPPRFSEILRALRANT